MTKEPLYLKKEKQIALLLLVPILCVYIIFIYYPVLVGSINAFTDYNIFSNTNNFIGLENFKQLFSLPDFSLIVQRTVIFTIIVVTLQYILGLGLALLLNQELKGFRWFKNMVMIPWVLPITVTVIIFTWITHAEYGLLNIFFRAIGKPEWVTFWFGNQNLAFWGVVFLHIWRNVPFYALVLYAALKNIPKTYYEAAKIDGASEWTMLGKITMPMILSQSIVVIILHIIFTINNVDIILLATGGGPVGSTEVLSTKAYNIMWNTYNFGVGTALSLLILLVLCIITIISMKIPTEIE
ncbi:MAG: carbohydrate ABC transporter permease [Brevinema sp.]